MNARSPSGRILLSTAYHEAGHAVPALVLNPDPDPPGHFRLWADRARPDWLRKSGARLDGIAGAVQTLRRDWSMPSRFMVAMGGPAAEATLVNAEDAETPLESLYLLSEMDDRDDWIENTPDFSSAASLLRRSGYDAVSDLERFFPLCLEWIARPPVLEAIKAVAAALLSQKPTWGRYEMRYQEVAAIIERIIPRPWGPRYAPDLPPPALSAWTPTVNSR